MTIYQPEDKTLTKERIESMLILLNYPFDSEPLSPSEMQPMLDSLNRMPNLKGRFTLSEKGEIVFVAQ